ncbi:hypothetical protein PSHI_49980 [Pseudomonas sp. URMO17WK12:I11]|nr:hypothetical protein PSHI_49980 [Pseudomonas sp. URMO17WK12:I11]
MEGSSGGFIYTATSEAVTHPQARKTVVAIENVRWLDALGYVELTLSDNGVQYSAGVLNNHTLY